MLLVFLFSRQPLPSTLFPYTTLFRSCSRRTASSTWARVLESAAARSCSSVRPTNRSEEHTSELQSLTNLVCRLLLEKKKISESQRDYRCRRAVQPREEALQQQRMEHV